jgi:purine-cytosine permease-like protein
MAIAETPAHAPKRRYNRFVNNPVIEDYSLRYAPKSFRRWSEYAVATAALGGIAYLADFAIGGSIAISSGFTNAFWAILTAAVIIFLTGTPIAYYSSRYNIDMDLLTRGAGFGYLGSTLTSVIYASFTFIFFALEGSIMAQAFNLYFGLPLGIGYAVGALIIIPLVVFGMTLLSKLQIWTQPVWLVMMVAPFIAVIVKEPSSWANWYGFAGSSPSGAGFNPLLFGTACGVALSLIAQIGEQVDYLRFMPDKPVEGKSGGSNWKWWLAVLGAGPGWVIIGALKQLGGSFFTALAFKHGVPLAQSNEPIQMYVQGFRAMFSSPAVYLALATFFVVLSQIKINVTNAYSGSLSWSNFFARFLHAHPGRVVWLLLNVGIALTLMELGVFSTLLWVLGFYSNVAIAWIGAVVADLVVNKPLGLSPNYIEFKRAHLYNFNPVGFGSMVIASIISVIAFFGLFGPTAQAFSTFIALGIAFVLSPIIAYVTKGKYYLARPDSSIMLPAGDLIACSQCSFEFERADMAYCPFNSGAICSLCCSLEASCHDACKASTVRDAASGGTREVPGMA